jgi:hypothetical protein
VAGVGRAVRRRGGRPRRRRQEPGSAGGARAAVASAVGGEALVEAVEGPVDEAAGGDPHSPFYRLGLLRSDYSPKPAFATYRRLVADLSA